MTELCEGIDPTAEVGRTRSMISLVYRCRVQNQNGRVQKAQGERLTTSG